MTRLGPLAPTIIGIMWLETVLATICVCLRLYTRTRIIKTIGWEDYLAVASIVLFYGYTIFCTIAAVHGLGSHYADLTLSQFVLSNKMEVFGQTFNIIAIATSKCSVAAFLLRLVVSSAHKWFLWFCMITTTFVCISCATIDFVQCTPVESVWNPQIPHTCSLNFTANAIFSGSYTAMMDFVLAIFPWYFLRNIQMRQKERLTITISLSAGVLAGICGIIRAVELAALSARSDYSYRTVPLILWGSTELLIAIGCACVPVLRPLYKKVLGRHSSNEDSYGHNTSGLRKSRRQGSGYILSSVPHDTFSPHGVHHGHQAHVAEGSGSYYEDNISEQNILPDADRSNIKKTTTIVVSSASNI